MAVALYDMCEQSMLTGERRGISTIGGFDHDDPPVEDAFTIGGFNEVSGKSAQEHACAEHDHFFGK